MVRKIPQLKKFGFSEQSIACIYHSRKDTLNYLDKQHFHRKKHMKKFGILKYKTLAHLYKQCYTQEDFTEIVKRIKYLVYEDPLEDRYGIEEINKFIELFLIIFDDNYLGSKLTYEKFSLILNDWSKWYTIPNYNQLDKEDIYEDGVNNDVKIAMEERLG